MFDGLQGKLQEVFRQLKGEGRVSAEALEGALRQIRLALLEADVHIRVVRPFVDRLRERAVGQEVLASLTPAQQVIKIVRDELTALLGEEGRELELTGRPAAILLCGLQGSGKTTTAGKLGKRLAGRGRHPVLIAGDLQRAAAVEQLVQVGRGVGLPVITPAAGEGVLDLAGRAVREARERGHDVLIFDTAGRLHVDEELMAELREVAARVNPDETLFVADAMTGQDAVKSAERFAADLALTGVILTKLDGDTRGGAALSIRTVARVPIRFVGVGERADELELFHPERMASRMIGMGDVMSLIERAEEGIDRGEAERLAGRLVRDEFTLGGPPRPAPPAPPPGAPGPGAGDDAQGGAAQGARRRPGRRGAAQAGGGDHRLDDPARAPPPAGARRQPQAAGGPRLRHLGDARQPAAQAVQDDAQDAPGGAGELAPEGPGRSVELKGTLTRSPRRPIPAKLLLFARRWARAEMGRARRRRRPPASRGCTGSPSRTGGAPLHELGWRFKGPC